MIEVEHIEVDETCSEASKIVDAADDSKSEAHMEEAAGEERNDEGRSRVWVDEAERLSFVSYNALHMVLAISRVLQGPELGARNSGTSRPP